MFGRIAAFIFGASQAQADAPGAPSPQAVRGVWRHLQSYYHSTVIHKSNAPEMQALAATLSLANIPISRDQFLNEYATTIGPRIYVPFDVGTPGRFTLLDQLYLAVHEHEHVHQSQRDGFRYEQLYVTDSGARAAYEAEAMAAEAELSYWLNGTLPNAYVMVGRLGAYGCSADDIQVALEILLSRYATILGGLRSSEAASVAIDYLSRNAIAIRTNVSIPR